MIKVSVGNVSESFSKIDQFLPLMFFCLAPWKSGYTYKRSRLAAFNHPMKTERCCPGLWSNMSEDKPIQGCSISSKSIYAALKTWSVMFSFPRSHGSYIQMSPKVRWKWERIKLYIMLPILPNILTLIFSQGGGGSTARWISQY